MLLNIILLNKIPKDTSILNTIATKLSHFFWQLLQNIITRMTEKIRIFTSSCEPKGKDMNCSSLPFHFLKLNLISKWVNLRALGGGGDKNMFQIRKYICKIKKS